MGSGQGLRGALNTTAQIPRHSRVHSVEQEPPAPEMEAAMTSVRSHSWTGRVSGDGTALVEVEVPAGPAPSQAPLRSGFVPACIELGVTCHKGSRKTMVGAGLDRSPGQGSRARPWVISCSRISACRPSSCLQEDFAFAIPLSHPGDAAQGSLFRIAACFGVFDGECVAAACGAPERIMKGTRLPCCYIYGHPFACHKEFTHISPAGKFLASWVDAPPSQPVLLLVVRPAVGCGCYVTGILHWLGGVITAGHNGAEVASSLAAHTPVGIQSQVARIAEEGPRPVGACTRAARGQAPPTGLEGMPGTTFQGAIGIVFCMHGVCVTMAQT